MGALDLLPFAVFGLFLLGYVALLLYKEDFVYYDYSLLSESVLSGARKLPTIIPAFGRFYPLAFQEFNLLSLVTSTAVGYQFFSIFQILIAVGLLFLLQESRSASLRLIIISAILVTPSITVAFGGLIYPERNVVFWLLLFLIFRRQYMRSPSAVWGGCSIIAAQFLIYYKETAFLLVFGMSALAILAHLFDTDRRRFELKRLRDPECLLDLVLLALIIVFLVYYFIIMLRTGVSQKYVDDAKKPFLDTIALYIKSDLLLPALVIALIWRWVYVIRNRRSPDLFWDGCGFAALLYMLSYSVLRLFSSYYMAPVDVLAILYICHFVLPEWSRLVLSEKFAAWCFSAILIVQILCFSNMKIIERKNLIAAQVEVSNFLIAEHDRAGGQPLHLFFPFSKRYARQEFASYLRYRGLEPERDIKEELQSFNVTLSSPVDPLLDGRCMPWFNYVCRQQNEPRSGDLVVILPDDGASSNQLRHFAGDKAPTFFFQPFPLTPGWFVALARLVRPLQPNLPFTGNVEISDLWLHAYVYRWP